MHIHNESHLRTQREDNALKLMWEALQETTQTMGKQISVT